MKRFINKFFFFLLPLLIIYVTSASLVLILSFDINNLFKKQNIENSIENIIIGDSYIKTGLNDENLPGFLNLGGLSQSYFYTYGVLTRFFEGKNQIKKVYLGRPQKRY